MQLCNAYVRGGARIIVAASTSKTSRADRREQLLDAAYRAFMATGYLKTSMSDIAREADVSRPTLYRVFETKEKIFRAVAERLHAQTQRACAEASLGPEDGIGKIAAMATTKLGVYIDIIASSTHGPSLLELNQRIAGDLAAESKRMFQGLVTASIESSPDIVLSPGHSPNTAARIITTLIDGWEHRVLTVGTALPRTWRSQVTSDVLVIILGLTSPVS